MGIIYLAATILGLGMLLFQVILSGSGADGTDGLEAADGLEDGSSHFAGENAGHDSFFSETVGLFLSMRLWSYGLAAFGLVGGILTLFQLAGFVTTLLLAIGTGLGSGLTVALIFRKLSVSVSSTSSINELIGKTARVTAPMINGSMGKIQLTSKDKRLDLLARTDTKQLQAGQTVLIIAISDDHAIVEPLNELDSAAAKVGLEEHNE